MSDRFTCTKCWAGDDQADCDMCGGSGYLRDVPFAKAPWNELVPGLWLGGHVYQPEGEEARQAVTQDIREAGFKVVISFYKSPGCWAPEETESHYLRIVDGKLTDVEMENVEILAYRAADRVRDGKKVLLRCQAGLNRSALCAALALHDLGWEMPRAINLIRVNRSPYALCNGKFVDHLLSRGNRP